jgi:hypothetical protein
MRAKHIVGDLEGFFEGAKTITLTLAILQIHYFIFFSCFVLIRRGSGESDKEEGGSKELQPKVLFFLQLQ